MGHNHERCSQSLSVVQQLVVVVAGCRSAWVDAWRRGVVAASGSPPARRRRESVCDERPSAVRHVTRHVQVPRRRASRRHALPRLPPPPPRRRPPRSTPREHFSELINTQNDPNDVSDRSSRLTGKRRKKIKKFQRLVCSGYYTALNYDVIHDAFVMFIFAKVEVILFDTFVSDQSLASCFA